MNLRKHLLERWFYAKLYDGVYLDDEGCVLTVSLWNLSGQMVGFQQYAPLRSKERQPEPRDMRYYTYATKSGSGSQLSVFGLETLHDVRRPVFLTEGIFDASRLHWHGHQALAVLGSNPMHLRSWLGTMPYEMIPCVQGDKAGKALDEYKTRRSILLPDEHDVGSLTHKEFTSYFGGM